MHIKESQLWKVFRFNTVLPLSNPVLPKIRKGFCGAIHEGLSAMLARSKVPVFLAALMPKCRCAFSADRSA